LLGSGPDVVPVGRGQSLASRRFWGAKERPKNEQKEQPKEQSKAAKGAAKRAQLRAGLILRARFIERDH